MPDRPNILVITSDQHHFSALGCVTPAIKTPNLDRLAAEGMRFDRAYCPNPTCTPTRASIITGMYPSQHGAWSLGTKLMEDVHTVGEDFIKAGYRTGLVGKAHFQPTKATPEYPSLESMGILQDLDFWRSFSDRFYGFDHVELARNHTCEFLVGQHYAIWLEENGCDNWRDYFAPPTGNREHRLYHWEIPEEYHYDAWIAERTNALLTDYSENGENFFLWASFFDPHGPYLAPSPWDVMYDPDDMDVPEVTPGEHEHNPPHFQWTQQRDADWSVYREPGGNTPHGMSCHLSDRQTRAKNMACYYGMVSLMDKYIGQILDHLDGLGLAENTLVVFTTDHGEFLGQHGLRAKGPFHYEDLIRIPFLARYPGQIEPGTTCDALQSLVDLAPTFLTVCGLPVPGRMSGVDQSQVWFGQADSARDHAIVENRHQPTTIHVKTYVDDRYKLTVYYQRDYGELFDLQEDPGELHNLWDDANSQALKQELITKLLFAEMGKEPLPMPRISGA